MKLVIDSNSIISALIREGSSRTILFDNKFRFFTPDHALNEISRHEEEIRNKSNVTHEQFELLLTLLFDKIEIISKDR